MYTEQTNETLALANQALELMNADIRTDHYDGEHSLYRLAAYVPINQFVPNFYDSPELEYILTYLSNLPVKPHRIFVDGAGGVEVDWFANGAQVVTSKTQYVQLIMEFEWFLKVHSSAFFTLELQEGMFSDDPNERITGYPSEELNFKPKFNAECFGNDGVIEAIRC